MNEGRTFEVRKRQRRRERFARPWCGLPLLALLGLLCALLAPSAALAQDTGGTTIVPSQSAAPDQVATDWSPPRTVYIPETGQTIDRVFLDFWRNGGGVTAYGYPITPEFTDASGHIAQYYGYARFEYWPEDPNGNVVHLGQIGAELAPAQLALSFYPFDLASHPAPRDQISQFAAWQPLSQRQASPETDNYVYIPDTKHSVGAGFKTFWENSGGVDYLGNPLTEEYIIDGVTYQVFERGQLTWQPGQDVAMVPVGSVLADRAGIDQSPRAQGDIPTYSEDLFVPPPPPAPATGGQTTQPAATGEKWIEISISEQYLIAWQGDTEILSTYVSTGRDGFDTPTGIFFISVKTPSEDMEGVIGGEYYNVPDVPWVMYFTDRGHALHGTYWHNNFGTPMSHGCVNLPMDVAEWMYGWAPSGTRVEIHY